MCIRASAMLIAEVLQEGRHKSVFSAASKHLCCMYIRYSSRLICEPEHILRSCSAGSLDRLHAYCGVRVGQALSTCCDRTNLP